MFKACSHVCTPPSTIWRGQTNNKLTKILGRAFSMSTERHRKLKWDEFGGNPELDVLITTNPDFKINLSQTIGDAQRTLFRAQLDNTNLDGQGICGKSLKSVLLERLEDITKAFPSKTFSKLIPQTSPRCLEAFERTLPGLSSRQLSELTMSSDDVFISYFVDHKVDPTHSKLQEVTLAIFEITHFGKIRRYHDQRGQIDKELDNDLYQGAQLEQTRDKYIRGLDRLRETSNRIPDWEKEGVFRARNAKFRFSSDIQDWVLTDFVFIPFSQLSAMDKIKWKSIVNWNSNSSVRRSTIGVSGSQSHRKIDPERLLRFHYAFTLLYFVMFLVFIFLFNQSISIYIYGTAANKLKALDQRSEVTK
ncbi:uncharacterized protein LOC131892792 [Tigriopus californicus]|uniref:uncharacterized protein LOC131892792 n=1 Tax=Tigriopus californicus TaxID=6832 RepID=UPI0027DA6FE5|nr:uncharacterized protein LOC131892792 [Tigriopus californicus]